MGVLLNYEWIGGLLLLLTCFLVVNDRAFSRRIRAEYLVALVSCMVLYFWNQRIRIAGEGVDIFTRNLVFSFEAFLRPVIILMLIYVSNVWGDRMSVALSLLLIPDLVMAVSHFWIGALLIFCLYVVVLVITLFVLIKRDDISDYVFAGILLTMIIAAIVMEQGLKYVDSFNGALGIVTCTYYFYFMIRTYKKDRLTGLLIRHNLNYELSDLESSAYDVVLMDVDNFKLINDKYGHERGDEVLVGVVEQVKEKLPKGCRMYRYGGDEFVILNRKVPLQVLICALDGANEMLEKQDLSFSYGIAHHNPGESGETVLNAADMAMYENKRNAKSEDIWDDMTGLFNYRGFLEELDILRRNTSNDTHQVCLIGVDIERLNSLNMVYGYTEGNAVITALSKVIKTNLRNNDFAGHLGSDEFALAIVCDRSDTGYVNSYIRQIQDGIKAFPELAEKEYSIRINTASLFLEQDDPMSADECVNTVLFMKKEEKENRRRRVVNYDEEDYNPEDEKEVMDILDHNYLRYAYQPIVSAKDGSIIAYEALMRSNTGNMVSPVTILSYADRADREYEIERLTFFNVLKDISSGDFPKDARIFVNSIPGYLLTDDDYKELKDQFGDWFKRLVIEITEQREVNNETLDIIRRRMSADGFNLAIDDYGSGCSNTNSLLRYMPQIIKLDRMLIAGIDRNVKKQFFVNSIISFAKENDMLILAEGVETEAELKMVIRLGIDLIQGYYTAKPEFMWLEEIPQNVRDVIINENLKVGNRKRMVYYANTSCELSAVHLAMDDYSKVVISSEKVTVTGRDEYSADLVIRIKDGVDTYLKLRDVRLNSVDDEPCIFIGEGCHVTLELEGDNQFNSKGIYVPEGSSLTMIGVGNLEMNMKGHECYAIGCDSEHAFGEIILKSAGAVKINLDGEKCIGIGGGTPGENGIIDLSAGYYVLDTAGVDCIGIGAVTGDLQIRMNQMSFNANFRVNNGIVIGIKNGDPDISIKNFALDIIGSGTRVCGIGSIERVNGKIHLEAGSFRIRTGGHFICLLGGREGEIQIEVIHTKLDMVGEGDNVLGIGTVDRKAVFNMIETSLNMTLNASNPLDLGVSAFKYSENVFNGSNVMVNGVKKEYQ